MKACVLDFSSSDTVLLFLALTIANDAILFLNLESAFLLRADALCGSLRRFSRSLPEGDALRAPAGTMPSPFGLHTFGAASAQPQAPRMILSPAML